jgi:formylglycine-generating enzyme required for sulfatase activity
MPSQILVAALVVAIASGIYYLITARKSELKAVARSKQLDSERAAARPEIDPLRTQPTAAGSEPGSGGASSPPAAGGTVLADVGASGLSHPARGRSHVNSIGMRLLGVDAGTFEMGSPSNESGRRSDEQRHRVTLTQAFWMAETKVTQGQWLAVMKAQPRWLFQSTNWGAEVAADNMNWTEAMDFCRRLTERERQAGSLPEAFEYTLPTEAQWEYVCRAGTQTAYSFGDDASRLGQYAVYEGSRDGPHAHRVKSRKANPWGFYDMHGNLWEWCRDEVGIDSDFALLDSNTYRDDIQDPLSLGGPQRVNRGGSWGNSPAYCRSAGRDASDPSGAGPDLGFRPVLASPTASGLEPSPGDVSSPAAAGGTAFIEVRAADLAQPSRGRSYVNSIGMRLLGVDTGAFEMGSPETEEGRLPWEQLHSVRLTQAFWMAETEVTQGQWLLVMKAEPRGGFQSTNRGAEVAADNMDWTEAMDFCRRLTEREREAGLLPEAFEYTLPTEAQWEYVCRAGTRTAYSFGDDVSKFGQYAVYEGSRDGPYAHRVKRLKPNPWGFYDMHGNVWEWCLDEVDWSSGGQSDTYRDGIQDPLAQGGPRRVLRGGGWFNSSTLCRSARRGASDPSDANGSLGFRPVLAPRSGGGAR